MTGINEDYLDKVFTCVRDHAVAEAEARELMLAFAQSCYHGGAIDSLKETIKRLDQAAELEAV